MKELTNRKRAWSAARKRNMFCAAVGRPAAGGRLLCYVRIRVHGRETRKTAPLLTGRASASYSRRIHCDAFGAKSGRVTAPALTGPNKSRGGLARGPNEGLA